MKPLEWDQIVQKQHDSDLEVRVARRWQAADGVAGIELVSVDGAPLPQWSAGSHIDILNPDSSARQYSLCGDPANTGTWRVGILREENGRGGSRWLHDEVRSGDLLKTRGPRNHFHFEPAAGYIFIAGGIGVTPILPMVAAAHASGAPYRVIYGGRSRTSMAFREELEQYGAAVEFCPEDECGLLDLERILADPTPGTHVYTCGPGALLDAIEHRSQHWPAGSVHMERFAPKEIVIPEGADHEFEVELARSGRVLTVPADRTLLEVLEEADTDVVSSCAEGTCGSCLSIVLSGEIDHRDSVLTDLERAAGDQIIVCVSRCSGKRLVLDL